MKPLSADVHKPLADWVKRGGALVVVDDDSDPYLAVREWWNAARTITAARGTTFSNNWALPTKTLARKPHRCRWAKGP